MMSKSVPSYLKPKDLPELIEARYDEFVEQL